MICISLPCFELFKASSSSMFFIGSLRHCSPPLQVEPLEQGQRLLKEVWTWDFSWHWENGDHALWPSPIHDGTLLNRLNQSGRCNSGTLRLCPLTLIIKKRRHFNLTNKYNYIYVYIYINIYIYISIYKYVYIYILYIYKCICIYP